MRGSAVRQLATNYNKFIKSPGPTAVVFLTMGGPSNQSEVKDFLFRLFSDSDIIPLGRFQPLIARLISHLRTPKIQKQYAAIGGGSPIRKWSEHQASATCALLDRISPASAPHQPYVAFRYAHPLTGDVYAKLLADGFGERGRVVAFSQYPQFSCGTTGSSVNELARWRQRLEDESSGNINWSIIDRWATQAKFTKAVAQNIQTQIQSYPEGIRENVTIVFSAHSQPVSAMDRGDPYAAEVASTVHAVMQQLNFSHPHRLTWQSKVGPQPWLGPQTAAVVREYNDKGNPNLVIVPIAFTSDHIETLYELDEELIGESGHAETIKRADSLNGSEIFIEALADVVKEHVENVERASRQFGVRCLGCRKESCRMGRAMFGS